MRNDINWRKIVIKGNICGKHRFKNPNLHLRSTSRSLNRRNRRDSVHTDCKISAKCKVYKIHAAPVGVVKILVISVFRENHVLNLLTAYLRFVYNVKRRLKKQSVP